MESQFRNKQTSQYLCLFRNHLDRNKTKKYWQVQLNIPANTI